MEDTSGHYALRIDIIENDREELGVTRRLASRIQDKTYLSIGEVLEDISIHDLRHLLLLSKAITPEGELDWPNVKRAYVFGLLMVTAEGAVSLTPANSDAFVNLAWQILALEIMSRRGFVDFDSSEISGPA